MAGAGYKLFNTGDVLTAAQVNTYLQEQTVMVFANSTARTTALSGVLAEGMVTYLKDTDAVEKYNGSAWVSIGGASPLTTKGDLYTYSTADARLAVGNNGETLVADSSQTTGLRYNAPVSSLANYVINGGMDIWQRGTSVAVSANSNAYTVDRWSLRAPASAACTVSRQTTSDTTNLPNIQYSARVQRNSGQTGTGSIDFYQFFETANTIPLVGKTVTLSYYAKAGANFSAASSVLTGAIYYGTGTDQNLYGTYTGATVITTSSATLTTTWQRFVTTFTVNTAATEIAIGWSYNGVGTASTNDWYEVTGVQLDIGTWTASTAPTFRRSGGTLAGELAACQRYYYRHVDGATQAIGVGYNESASSMGTHVKFPVTMRITPVLVASSGSAYYTFYRNGANDDFNSFTLGSASPNEAAIYNNSEISGTAGHAGNCYSNNASASVAFNSEL